jgi:hypothetical protein
MKSLGLLKFRMIMAIGCGLFLLLQSLNPQFLAPAVPSRGPLVHGFLALFGIAFLIQAAYLQRDLKLQGRLR